MLHAPFHSHSQNFLVIQHLENEKCADSEPMGAFSDMCLVFRISEDVLLSLEVSSAGCSWCPFKYVSLQYGHLALKSRILPVQISGCTRVPNLVGTKILL